MRLRLILTGIGSAAAVFTGMLVPTLSAPVSAATETTAFDVKVASFNLSSVSFDSKAAGDHRTWRQRRPTVVAQIIQQKVDALGLQEANQSGIYASSLDYGSTQYLDLKGALAAQGAKYALTSEAGYNCVRATSSNNCTYQNRQASQDNRIMYNTNTVTLVSQGAVKFPTQTPDKNERYLCWAVLKMKSTGKEFFFTNTHLDPYSDATRKAQWDESISITNQLKGTRPVVAVGDYNTSKFDTYAATYLPRMKANGYGDVLNQEYAKNTVTSPRAESLKRAWINSFNGFQRDVRSYAYEDAKTKIGNGIDWIFASNNVRVKEWAVLAAVDESTNLIRGVIPSDHSMVRATIVLP